MLPSLLLASSRGMESLQSNVSFPSRLAEQSDGRVRDGRDPMRRNTGIKEGGRKAWERRREIGDSALLAVIRSSRSSAIGVATCSLLVRHSIRIPVVGDHNVAITPRTCAFPGWNGSPQDPLSEDLSDPDCCQQPASHGVSKFGTS